jgi:hypothetical protein
VHGAIKYTQAERKAWETYMHERSHHKGKHFDPKDYPTTDMIVEEKK